MKKKTRWTRKTIEMPGCPPFPALVDMKTDKFGRHYFACESMGSFIYPECVKPEMEQDSAVFEKLERVFKD